MAKQFTKYMLIVLWLICLWGCGNGNNAAQQQLIDGCIRFLSAWGVNNGICGDNDNCVKITNGQPEFIGMENCVVNTASGVLPILK